MLTCIKHNVCGLFVHMVKREEELCSHIEDQIQSHFIWEKNSNKVMNNTI